MSLTGGGLGQKAQRRKLIFARGEIERGLLVGVRLGWARAGFVALDAAFSAFRQPRGGNGVGPCRTRLVIQMIGALVVIVFIFVVASSSSSSP